MRKMMRRTPLGRRTMPYSQASGSGCGPCPGVGWSSRWLLCMQVVAHAMASWRQVQVKRAPQQCLRYCFEQEAAPLWLSARGVPDTASVPCCASCGAQRCDLRMRSSSGE